MIIGKKIFLVFVLDSIRTISHSSPRTCYFCITLTHFYTNSLDYLTFWPSYLHWLQFKFTVSTKPLRKPLHFLFPNGSVVLYDISGLEGALKYILFCLTHLPFPLSCASLCVWIPSAVYFIGGHLAKIDHLQWQQAQPLEVTHKNLWNRSESLEIITCISGQLIFKTIQWGKNCLSANSSGTNGQPHAKQWSQTLALTLYAKNITQNGSKV